MTSLSILAETSISTTQWPEYVALAEAEIEAERCLQAKHQAGKYFFSFFLVCLSVSVWVICWK